MKSIIPDEHKEGCELLVKVKDDRPFADCWNCDILKDSTLHLARTSFHIVIQPMFKSDKARFELVVEAFDTIDKVKAKIEDEIGIPQGMQRLIRREDRRQLENDRTLSSYAIGVASVLRVRLA